MEEIDVLVHPDADGRLGINVQSRGGGAYQVGNAGQQEQLKNGDILVAIDGRPLSGREDPLVALAIAVTNHKKGPFTIRVERGDPTPAGAHLHALPPSPSLSSPARDFQVSLNRHHDHHHTHHSLR